MAAVIYLLHDFLPTEALPGCVIRQTGSLQRIGELLREGPALCVNVIAGYLWDSGCALLPEGLAQKSGFVI